MTIRMAILRAYLKARWQLARTYYRLFYDAGRYR